MTERTPSERTPSDVVAEQVTKARKSRGWTRAVLAGACARAGAPRLTESVLENIEYGRRDSDGRRRRTITVDELLALAVALSVAPANLLVPLDDDQACILTATMTEPAATARTWFRGHHPLAGSDRSAYYTFAPAREVERAAKFAELAEAFPEMVKFVAESEASDGKHQETS